MRVRNCLRGQRYSSRTAHVFNSLGNALANKSTILRVCTRLVKKRLQSESVVSFSNLHVVDSCFDFLSKSRLARRKRFTTSFLDGPENRSEMYVCFLLLQFFVVRIVFGKS